MIKSTIVKCDFCNEKILLRFQIGYFDIPFDFSCPNCDISIYGIKKINENNLIISNAKEISEEINNAKFYGNFSTEFLNKKVSRFNCLEDIINNGASPFMNTTMMFENYEKYQNIMEKMGGFLHFKEKFSKKIKPLHELFFNKRLDLIENPLLEFSENYIIKNDLDAEIALHQLITMGMNYIMPPNTLKEYTDMANKLMLGKEINETIKFIEFIETKINTKELSEKIIEIYDRWINDFEKYMSVIILSVVNKIDQIDKEKYGISTINFKDMRTFYADSYELILEMITLPVGLNNIIERKNYDCFPANSKINNFKTFFNNTKYQRLDALKDDEEFSKYLNINNNVRNSIAHFDYKINNETQLITFYDKYKSSEKLIEMYLFDFALLCYENIKFIVYLNELFYNIKKISYIKNGLRPNINPNFKEINI